MMLLMPLAAMLVLAPSAQDSPASAIAPVIGEDVGAVVHIDLSKWEPTPFLQRVLGKLADEADVNQATSLASEWVDSLKKAGAKDFYVLVEPADVPGMPVAVVPLTTGPDGRPMGGTAVIKVLTGGGPVSWPAAEVIRGSVVAGTPTALNRVRDAKPVARAEVLAALAAGSTAPIQIALTPGNNLRRVIEESMPALPPQIGGGPITDVSRGMRWASFTVDFEPKAKISAIIQAKDSDAAKSLNKLAETGLKFVAGAIRAEGSMGKLADAVGEMKPVIATDRVTMEADLEKAAALVSVPIGKAREAARRSQCVNNMKQLGLAMHNYYSNHDSLPPAFRASKDGKPLLSWRVLILPYLEQQTLYNQFHLDEAWDSPHNKTLISQMPKLYACPSGSVKLAAEGKTSYLVPRGDGTSFPGAEGVKFQDITDGLSNTFLVVEASDEAAVIWTKPDDWEVNATTKPDALFGHHPNGTDILFGDGSVKFIKQTIAQKTFQALFTRKGGEIVTADEY